MPIRKESTQIISALRSNLESCILGKSSEIQLLLTSLLASGHVLIEDVPGTGKTQLVKALAKSISGDYRRIQCNPDILPSDITGVSIFHPRDQQFYFRPGPVMTNILLVDEINRATTKSQAALLEVMEERNVTVDGETHDLPHPFMLIATQNPIDFEGTYTLPEAQLDRFMMKIILGYPDASTEKQLMLDHQVGQPVDRLEPVTHMEHIATIQQEIRNIHINEVVVDYMLELIRRTRDHQDVLLGASPRASLSLMMACKAYAFLQERDYVLPDDVKYLAPYVLSHRILLRSESRLESVHVESVLTSIIKGVNVPVTMMMGEKG